MDDSITASARVSTAQQFRAATEARRAAQKAMEAALPPERLAQITEAHQRHIAALMPRINPIIGPALEELQRTMAMHEAAFRSITLPYAQLNQSITAWQKVLSSSLITGIQRSAFESIRLIISFESSQIVFPNRTDTVVITEDEIAASPYLAITIDRIGNIFIGGYKMDRANVHSSRHGKLLEFFEANKDELVTQADIRDSLQVVNARRVIKDLRKDFRQAGFDPVIESYRRQGFIYKGTVTKQ